MNTNIRDVIKDKSVKIRLRWKWLLAMGVIMGIVMSQCSNGLEPVNMEDKPLEKPLPINTRPKILAIGSGFSVGIKPDGTVWTWGTNHHGILARPIKTKEEGYEPGQVHGLKGAVSVVASDHVLVLMRDGSVWSWGNNDKGQLGYKTATDRTDTPQRIPGISDVKDMAAMWRVSQVVKNDGTVWGWGWGWEIDGVLGRKGASIIDAPVQISDLENIVKIYIGNSVSFAINRDGRLYSYGNDRKLLGRNIENENSEYHSSGEIKFPNEVVDVSCYSDAAYALLSDGTVWSWGRNNGGQRGLGKHLKGYSDYAPVRISSLSRVVSISSAGGAVVVTEDGDLIKWGISAASPPPPAPLPMRHLYEPYRVDFKVAMPVIGMATGTALVDGNGDAFYWHSNAYGIRGTGKKVEDKDNNYWNIPEKSHWSYR